MNGTRHPTAHIRIRTDSDVITARQAGRAFAEQAGCSTTDRTEVATAISEVTRNILNFAREGEVHIGIVEDDNRRGVRIVAVDRGPGIGDVERALQDGYTTGSGLGLGLPGARRLMDHFEIISDPGQGTTVVMHKWCAMTEGSASVLIIPA